MTEKQEITLILFTQNYPLSTIAKKQCVSLSTIRKRIKSISKHYSKELNNAIALRNVYKRNRDALRSTWILTPANILKLEEVGSIKQVF